MLSPEELDKLEFIDVYKAMDCLAEGGVNAVEKSIEHMKNMLSVTEIPEEQQDIHDLMNKANERIQYIYQGAERIKKTLMGYEMVCMGNTIYSNYSDDTVVLMDDIEDANNN